MSIKRYQQLYRVPSSLVIRTASSPKYKKKGKIFKINECNIFT